MHGGNISNSQTVALYTHWTALCTDLKLDHLIEDLNLPSIKILQVYVHQVCHSHYYSRSNQLKDDLVAMERRAVVNAHLLEGRHGQRKTHGSHAKDLDKRLIRMLRHFSYEDLLPK